VVHTPPPALDAATLLRLLTCIVVIMVLGFWLGSSLQQHLGIVLPSYVGAMFVAIILRNLNDRAQVIEMPDHASAPSAMCAWACS
jgi:glutamate:Na+ symporter, ESS family